MIINLTKEETISDFIGVNIERPTFYTDSNRSWWLVFHNWVEEIEIPIIVNRLFFNIKKLIEDGDSYGGSGFKYMFYFQTQEDAEVFKKRWPGSYQPELLVIHHYIDENENKLGVYMEKRSKKEKWFLEHKQKKIEEGHWKEFSIERD